MLHSVAGKVAQCQALGASTASASSGICTTWYSRHTSATSSAGGSISSSIAGVTRRPTCRSSGVAATAAMNTSANSVMPSWRRCTSAAQQKPTAATSSSRSSRDLRVSAESQITIAAVATAVTDPTEPSSALERNSRGAKEGLSIVAANRPMPATPHSSVLSRSRPTMSSAWRVRICDATMSAHSDPTASSSSAFQTMPAVSATCPVSNETA